MKVSIIRGGGVLGVATRTELDAAQLPTDAAAELRRQVQAAGPLASTPAAESLPDEQSYLLTLEDEAKTDTAQYTERTLPQPVRSLIQWVDQRPERSDELVPPGAAA